MQTGGISRATLPSGPADATLPLASTNPRNIAQTTLGQFRRVQGEKQTVRFGRMGSADTSAVPYVLTQFPYAGDVQIFAEETLTGVTIRPNGYLDFTNAKDSQGNSVAHGASSPVPATIYPDRPRDDLRDGTNGQNCVFYVTYRWSPSSGARVQGVVDEPLVIPPDTPTTGWTATPPTNNRVMQTTGVIDGSVTVRVRKRVGTRTPGTATPASPVSEALVGLVRLDGFNNFQNVTQITGSVSLDYNVSDWRNIVLDEIPIRPLSGTTTNQWNVLTPMQNLTPEANILAFFARPDPDPTPAPSIPVLGGATWTEGTTPPVTGPRILDANLSAGRITYDIPPVDVGDPIPATPTRTVLSTPSTLTTVSPVVSTLDEWGHQLTVAATSYVPFVTGAGGTGTFPHIREGWREYYQNGPTLYFQASEAGKLVMVDYEYPDTTAPGGHRQVQGAVLPISSDLQNDPTANFAPVSRRVAAVRLIGLNGNGLASVSAITAVRGVSVAARTAWLENGRYQQVVTKGYRPLVSAL
jgi:hypothetical protein